MARRRARARASLTSSDAMAIDVPLKSMVMVRAPYAQRCLRNGAAAQLNLSLFTLPVCYSLLDSHRASHDVVQDRLSGARAGTPDTKNPHGCCTPMHGSRQLVMCAGTGYFALYKSKSGARGIAY